MIGREVSHYTILDRLGGGGMGVVYKAEDTRLGRVVALKFLNTELLSNESVRKRFLHEARAASSIDHPNVCHVYEVGEADGRYFMAMSYCEGRSLRDVVSDGPVAPREAFSIAFGIAQGLWAAHRRGIVHRDIKPGNVILTDDGFVRIVDFGLALLIGDSRVTTSGVTVGTVAYMSPEQTSDSTVSANTDIWSLGVTLYELLTGHLPFHGEVNAALVYSIVHEPHIPLPDTVPPPCARIVDRCLEKDPAKRYQTMEELLEDMVGAAQELGWESSVASATIAPILRERRRKVLTRRFAAIAATLIVLAGGAFAWKQFHVHSPYTTKIRLAVVPFENLVGQQNDAVVDGFSDHTSRIARWVGRGHKSMWTAVYSVVADAQLASPKQATGAFGANYVITGDVQRVGAGPRVRLKLLDAVHGRILRQASLAFDIDSTAAVMDSLPIVLGNWFGVDMRSIPRGMPWHARAPAAVRPYLEGLSYYRHSSNPAARDLTLRTLRTSTDYDSTFALANCARSYAELLQYNRDSDRAHLTIALQSGRRARTASPLLTDARVVLGNVFRAMQLPDSAEACYRSAIEVDGTSFPARERLADLCASQSRFEEAEQSYRDAVAARSDYWVARRFLGAFYYDQHKLDKATTEWQTALALAPDDIQSMTNLGAVYYEQGNWAGAQRILLRAFQVRPDCNSCNNVATSLYLDGKFKAAASYFELALSPEYCDSTDGTVIGNLASTLYWVDGSRPRALELYRRAINLAEKALASTPESPRLVARLVNYYAMSGDSVRAREMIARAEPFLQKDSEVMYYVGSACEKLGNRPLAMRHLANAVRHGYQLSLIKSDPTLHDLVRDDRFLKMISIVDAADGAKAVSNSP
ncbi:MAG TPA: protein kinase [Candidatus Krumholzibacteria bacterium]|nr:protein kinase [Candidatus Krumholzibacteria bacterium]